MQNCLKTFNFGNRIQLQSFLYYLKFIIILIAYNVERKRSSYFCEVYKENKIN